MKLPILGIQALCERSQGLKEGEHKVHVMLDTTRPEGNHFVFVAIEWSEKYGMVLVTDVPSHWIDEHRLKSGLPQA